MRISRSFLRPKASLKIRCEPTSISLFLFEAIMREFPTRSAIFNTQKGLHAKTMHSFPIRCRHTRRPMPSRALRVFIWQHVNRVRYHRGFNCSALSRPPQILRAPCKIHPASSSAALLYDNAQTYEGVAAPRRSMPVLYRLVHDRNQSGLRKRNRWAREDCVPLKRGLRDPLFPPSEKLPTKKKRPQTLAVCVSHRGRLFKALNVIHERGFPPRCARLSISRH